ERDRGDEVSAGLWPRPSLGSDVAIVEREERNTELLDELERGIELRAHRRRRVHAGGEPRPVEGADPEHIRARPVERVPEADRDAQLLSHGLPHDNAIRLVDRVGQWVA